MKSEILAAKDLARQALVKLIPQKFAAILVHLLDRVQQLKAGRYLMTHAKGSPTVSIFHGTSAPGAKVDSQNAFLGPNRSSILAQQSLGVEYP